MTKVEVADGYWEGDVTKNGRTYEFHANLLTGKLKSVKKQDTDHD